MRVSSIAILAIVPFALAAPVFRSRGVLGDAGNKVDQFTNATLSDVKNKISGLESKVKDFGNTTLGDIGNTVKSAVDEAGNIIHNTTLSDVGDTVKGAASDVGGEIKTAVDEAKNFSGKVLSDVKSVVSGGEKKLSEFFNKNSNLTISDLAAALKKKLQDTVGSSDGAQPAARNIVLPSIGLPTDFGSEDESNFHPLN